MIQDEIREIAEDVAEEKIAEIPKIEFPEIQRVEVVNQVEPIVNVAAPIVNVPEPRVTVNVPEVKIPNITIPEIKIPQITVPENTSSNELLSQILERINEGDKDWVKKLEKAIKEISFGNASWSPVTTEIINSRGTASTYNTTTTALGSGLTYTGTFEQNHHPDVMVSCIASNSGTLYFDFSPDGTNVNTFPTGGFKVSAGIHEFHIARKGLRYFRLRLVNDTGAQTYLRLYTYFGSFGNTVAPLNQPLGLNSDAILVRPTYTWLDISRGLVTGMSVVKKFGRNPAVGTSYVPVTIGGNYRTPQSGSATTLRIKAGGNANDTANGSGAQEITIIGLDQNFNEATEALATNGASASSATTTTFTRVYRAHVSKSGTYATQTTGSHSAAITVENGAGGTDWFTIDATGFPKGQTEIGAYSVPTGWTAYVFRTDITVDTSKTTDVILFHRAGIDETSPPYSAMRTKAVAVGLKAPFTVGNAQLPLGPFVGPCDIGYLAKVDSTTANVSVEFEVFLVQE